MQIQDFQGLTKYKYILPICYVISWTLMLLGPIYFESLYAKFCIAFIIYIDLKILFLTLSVIYISFRAHLILNKIKNKKLIQEGKRAQLLSCRQQLFYAIIIPNYMQSEDMLCQTLENIASHPRASGKYLIFLAMEAHQQQSQLKAKKIVQKFQHKFKLITYTCHQIRQFEQKGKASNVSWCAQKIQKMVQNQTINPQNIILTIIDADSWVPAAYFDILEQKIQKQFQNRHKLIFQPLQIFTRNNLNVPIFTRVYDIMHSFMHMSNLYSFFNFTFSLSNYSISLKLIKNIGFWDTCPDAIGQDFHTTLKAYWKTNGNIKTVPIYVPFNQINISTGRGYFEDVVARFWQAQRHSQGCSDFAWSIKMVLKTKFKFKNLLIFYQVMQNYGLPAFLPWVFISLMLQSNILYPLSDFPQQNYNSTLLPFLFRFMSIVSTSAYIIYEFYKRRANKIIYQKSNQSLWRIIEYPLVFNINLFVLGIPSFIMATFGVLAKDRQYIVAEKKNAVDMGKTSSVQSTQDTKN